MAVNVDGAQNSFVLESPHQFAGDVRDVDTGWFKTSMAKRGNVNPIFLGCNEWKHPNKLRPIAGTPC